MTMSFEAAAGAMREAMRATVKRHSLWYLIQGALMVLGGVLALVYPTMPMTERPSPAFATMAMQGVAGGAVNDSYFADASDIVDNVSKLLRDLGYKRS